MVQQFGNTNIRGKFSKYTSIFANQSWDLESMPQTQPYLVNWLKILKMDHDSFSRQCYDEMCKTDKLGTTNWVTKVKRMLFSYGYGRVWLTQSVGDETQLLNSFRFRIEDNFRQEWYTDISENKKLETYKTFKSLPEPKIYLTTIDSVFSEKRVIIIQDIKPQLNDRVR